MKGPLVYCLEEADNGDLLSQVYVEPNEKVTEDAPAPSLMGEIPVLTYPGKRISNKGMGENLYGALEIEKKDTVLKAVPYCQWNNRGEGEMLVWHKVTVG